MSLELRSPEYDRAAIEVPGQCADLSRPFNGTICSKEGDEYPIQNNIIDMIKGAGPLSPAQSTNHWKVTASLYENLWRKRSLTILTGEEFPVEKERELLLEWLDPEAGGRYLDVGCSTALYARMVKKKHPESTVTALDLSRQMLEEARLKAEADKVDLYLLRADARKMPFFASSFDGIMMGGTLNELTDELKVLYECRRVLSDKGRLFMMHLVRARSWYGKLFQDSAEWSGLKFFTLKESNQLFERAGFEVDEQFVRGIVCFTRLVPA